MPGLLTLLWNDEVGSTLSAEMALVTSVTVGALFSSMSQFSATIDREFKANANAAGLRVETDDQDKTKKKDEKKRKPSLGWRFRRAEDQEASESESSND